MRRAALAGGVAWGVWLVAWSPEALFFVRPVNFEAMYAERYAAVKGRRMPGAMAAAKEFLRRETNPGSVDGFRERTLENRLLTPAVDAAAWRRGMADEGVWLTGADPGIAAHLEQMKKIREVWLVSYLPAGPGPNEYLEIRWDTTPKESKAPAALVHPYRQQGWAWMAAGLLVYLLLGRGGAKREEAHADEVMIGVLDGVAVFFFGVIFYFPLYLQDSPGEALADVSGIAFFWSIAGLFLIRLWKNAGVAARRVVVEEGGLRMEWLTGSRVVPLASVVRVEPLVRKEDAVGWRLHLADGGSAELDWTDLVNVGPVRRVLPGGRSRAAQDVG